MCRAINRLAGPYMEPSKIPREYDSKLNREEITWTEVPNPGRIPQGSYPAS